MKFFVIFLQSLAITGAFGNETNNSTETHTYAINAHRSFNEAYGRNPVLDMNRHVSYEMLIKIKEPINSENPMTGMFEVYTRDKLLFDANSTNQLILCNNNYTNGSWEYFVTKLAYTNLIDEDNECDVEPGIYPVSQWSSEIDLIVSKRLQCGEYFVDCYLFWNNYFALVAKYSFFINYNCIENANRKIPRRRKYGIHSISSEQSPDY